VSSSVRSGRLAAAAALVTAGLLLWSAAPSPAGAAQASGDFFGVTPQAPLAAGDLGKMAGLGLTLRIPVYWSEVESQRGSYDFSSLDRTIGRAAGAGVRVLPFVYGSPDWATPAPSVPPLRGSAVGAWRAFLVQLVDRYGSRGSFWQGRSAPLPIRRWQIWNEPNFKVFWRRRPSPRAYVALLRRSASAVRGADPRAEVVAAGLAPVEGGLFPWEFLRRMYEVRGARQSFDLAALHPYAVSMGALEYELRAVRRVMARAGDGSKPLLVTEIGVASDGAFRNPFDKGRRGQARFLESAFGLMLENRRRWHLAGAYWFTWKDGVAADPYCVFCEFAGLFDRAGRAKPAWRALRRTAARLASGVR
jgi:hypothetical protein